MAGGVGATSRAAVILAAEEEAVGPAVVETQRVLGEVVGAIRNGRIYLRGSIFFVVYDTAGKVSGGGAERPKTLFVGQIKCQLHVGDCMVGLFHFSPILNGLGEDARFFKVVYRDTDDVFLVMGS
jgi:hypothetical protein